MRFEIDETYTPHIHKLRWLFPDWRWSAFVEEYSWLYVGVRGTRHVVIYSLASRYFDADLRKRRWYAREKGYRPVQLWQWFAGELD